MYVMFIHVFVLYAAANKRLKSGTYHTYHGFISESVTVQQVLIWNWRVTTWHLIRILVIHIINFIDSIFFYFFHFCVLKVVFD